MEQHIFPEDRCVMCGAVISEGRQVCRDCERMVLEKERLHAALHAGSDGEQRSVRRSFLKGLLHKDERR